MNNYKIRVPDLCLETYAIGSSGMAAFEAAVANGTIWLPTGEIYKVVAINTESGIATSFEAAMGWRNYFGED